MSDWVAFRNIIILLIVCVLILYFTN